MVDATGALTVRGFAVPAVADSSRLRLFLGTILYLAQGFPQGIFFMAIPAWLAANGQSTEVVAMAAAAAGLPWSFKFIAGLLMDRYTWLPMGRRRPWLVGSQTGIVITLLLVSILSPQADQTELVIGFILFLSTLTAIQDVALDALVVDLTPHSEMGQMNGYLFGGKLFGIAGGMAITTYLLEYHGFAAAMLGMMALFAIPALAIVLIREREGEKLLPWTSGASSPDAINLGRENWVGILGATLRNLMKPQSIVVAMVLLSYGIHQSLHDTSESLFAIRELGWSQAQYGSVSAGFNIAIGVFCLTLGGWLVDRFGPGRIAFWSGISALLIMGGYLFDPSLWKDNRLFLIWLGLKIIPLFLFYLANLVMAMRVAAPQVAATSFAVFMAIPVVGFMFASAILPSLEDWGGFQAMFGASAVMIFIAGLTTIFLSAEVRLPRRAEI